MSTAFLLKKGNIQLIRVYDMQTLHIKYNSKGKQETFGLFKQKCDSCDFHDHGIGQ